LQEEIQFMINPELIAGMLFMPAMVDNESIEILGVERYSTHEGYGPTFRFKGDFHDLTL
jgi:poly(ADP-ribose) glycohydrolase